MTHSPPVALITGGSRGLGATLATFLGAEGIHLVLTARDPGPLTATATRLRARGVRVEALPGDVAREEDRRRWMEAVGSLGRLDLLVNNASALGPSPRVPLRDLPVESFREILEVNLVGPLRLIQLAHPFLAASHGRIWNISSDAAREGYAGWGGYGGSKAALDLLSKTLAEELRDDGISVVSVDPGDMRTALHQAAYPGESIDDRPLPEVTLPFWAWLLGQPGDRVSGERYRAQGDRWEVRP